MSELSGFEEKQYRFENVISEAVQSADHSIMNAARNMQLSSEEVTYLTAEVAYRMQHKVLLAAMHEVRKREVLEMLEAIPVLRSG